MGRSATCDCMCFSTTGAHRHMIVRLFEHVRLRVFCFSCVCVCVRGWAGWRAGGRAGGWVAGWLAGWVGGWVGGWMGCLFECKGAILCLCVCVCARCSPVLILIIIRNLTVSRMMGVGIRELATIVCSLLLRSLSWSFIITIIGTLL